MVKIDQYPTPLLAAAVPRSSSCDNLRCPPSTYTLALCGGQPGHSPSSSVLYKISDLDFYCLQWQKGCERKKKRGDEMCFTGLSFPLYMWCFIMFALLLYISGGRHPLPCPSQIVVPSAPATASMFCSRVLIIVWHSSLDVRLDHYKIMATQLIGAIVHIERVALFVTLS